jgi:hypothetical protein
MVISDGIPAVPQNRKLSEFLSMEQNSLNSVLNPSAEEKTSQNSVTWNKNRRRLSEFRSEPFHRRKQN